MLFYHISGNTSLKVAQVALKRQAMFLQECAGVVASALFRAGGGRSVFAKGAMVEMAPPPMGALR